LKFLDHFPKIFSYLLKIEHSILQNLNIPNFSMVFIIFYWLILVMGLK